MSRRESAGEPVRTLVGIGASPGIVIGKAYVVHSESFRIFPRRLTDEEVEGEIDRFKEAVAASRQEILVVKEAFLEKGHSPDLTEIFDTHIHLLEDPVLTDETIRRVREEKRNVEFIFSQNVEAIEERFSSVPDEYLRQRLQDIQAVSGRILRKLLRKERQSLSHLSEKVVLIAHDLTPAETASMDKENVLAFATDVGGRTSHMAIMAKALEIPAVVGVQTVTQYVKNDDIVIVDGLQGTVIVAPDEQMLNEYQVRRERYLESERLLTQLKDLPAQTVDGHIVTLSANIDLPEEIGSAVGHGASGIGLFRTEFLFLNRTVPPSEDEQTETYSQAARLVSPDPITIRSLDIGGDKLLGSDVRYQEVNPFMGCRAIRFCLAHPEIFKPQLRAILRATAHGRVRLIVPMVTSLSELRRAKAMLDEARDELRAEGIPFDPEMPVGVMIETPSAVIIADVLAQEVDFFSIGTNDLIQYALAVDRVNERIAHLYEPTHPGILRMLKLVVDASRKAGVSLSICGEIAGDLPLALVLVGLGVRELSMAAAAIPEVKKLIRSVSLKDIERLASRLLELSTGEDVRAEIQRTIAQLVPNHKDYELFTWART
ncbi:MAG: phosphoenolpyruvate--protein phosphotransferase [Candidatus Abyssobacteria bacterium SURF_17]|uniref:Phosphoenolpyruvate-protein phosphotransferase n=1 Tax=Candidatus Abyssobacteria bacterium SURF_17 TaxID=2093361 RepID=A0A419EW86_9BACT|nr:MAG: phosphoenolpyruvate--protein phosphotransferase [Candidatus Abyssubacteria bacterium SURF_17]